MAVVCTSDAAAMSANFAMEVILCNMTAASSEESCPWPEYRANSPSDSPLMRSSRCRSRTASLTWAFKALCSLSSSK